MNNKNYFQVLFVLCGLVVTSCGPNTSTRPVNEKTGTGYYNEKYRPQFHFSPEASWMNDPNGMVFFRDEYHLFYQYYPDSTVWGPMHWGHAVSSDMVRWTHLPVALYHDSLGYIFSSRADLKTTNKTE